VLKMDGGIHSPIYRSIKSDENVTSKLHQYRITMRPPGNVPYVVDNLWEWKRPPKYPNRRFSVFASPKPDLAQELGPEGGRVYRVSFNGRYTLCQLKGYKDSKDHPDCRKLRKVLFEKLGNWLDSDLVSKKEVGALWIPCLTQGEVKRLFGTVEMLKKIRDDIYESINYWKDVVVIKKGEPIPDPRGELFFEAMEGFFLLDISNRNL
jgi:hypothetical protein